MTVHPSAVIGDEVGPTRDVETEQTWCDMHTLYVFAPSLAEAAALRRKRQDHQAIKTVQLLSASTQYSLRISEQAPRQTGGGGGDRVAHT